MTTGFVKRKEKKWPRWLFFIKPHQGGVDGDYIVRCSCGRAMWLQASQKIRRHHTWCHQIVPAQDGSMWEFFKMKTGLLRWRTMNEWLRDLLGI